VIKNIVLLVAAFCLTTPGVHGEDLVQIIVRDLRDSKIASVEVFGAPEIVESNEAVSAKVLGDVAKHRFKFTAKPSQWRTRCLLYALEAARPAALDTQNSVNSLDLRWGCFLEGTTPSQQHRLYLDASKNEGLVDGQAYVFASKFRIWFYLVMISSYQWAGLNVWTWALLIIIAAVLAIFLTARRMRRNRRKLTV
jgi:hypothetical protein